MSRTSRRLLAVNLALCGLLLVQFLLGMAVNLYVNLPDRHPGVSAGNYFSGAAAGLGWVIARGPVWVAVHVVVGLALVVAALAAVVLTWRRAGRVATTTSVVGALAITGAAFNGTSFVNYGHDVSSMIMAGLWALAFACYLTGLVVGVLHIDNAGERA